MPSSESAKSSSSSQALSDQVWICPGKDFARWRWMFSSSSAAMDVQQQLGGHGCPAAARRPWMSSSNSDPPPPRSDHRNTARARIEPSSAAAEAEEGLMQMTTMEIGFLLAEEAERGRR